MVFFGMNHVLIGNVMTYRVLSGATKVYQEKFTTLSLGRKKLDKWL